ncbi:MAG TPA: hypothetical protein VD913_01465, partial [bacterium]|nr:hypothetical protein [bacterium]
MITAAYEVSLGREAGLRVFEGTLKSIQEIFNLTDEDLKALELADKIRLITAAYAVSLGREAGLRVFEGTLKSIQGIFNLTDEDLKA